MWYKLAFAAVLSVASLSLVAEEEHAGDEFVHGEEDEDAVWEEWERIHRSRVSVDFAETSFDEAVSRLAKLTGANIVLTGDGRKYLARNAKVMPAVSLKLNNVPCAKAVDALARAAGLMLEVDPPVFYLTVPARDKIGEIELTTGAVTIKIDLRPQDIPPEMRREIVHRTLEIMERKAEMAERQAEAKVRRKITPRMEAEMFDNLPPDARERIMKLMQKMAPDMRKRGRKDDREVPHDAPEPAVF